MERTEIDAIRRMPLADFLARLGHEPVRRSGNELWCIALLANLRERCLWGGDTKKFHTQFGVGIKFVIN